MKLPFAIVVFCALLPLGQAGSKLQPDPPITCQACEAWNGRRDPVKVFGTTYDVSLAGLGAVLITSDNGHILLDGGLPQSAAVIDASIRTLGFRTEDVRLIVNSHAHYDHAGGIAAIQRLSGATVAASAAGARALERGEPTPDDPQFALGPAVNRFPAVKNVRTVADGEVLRVGELAITAHLTPGHTPGSTTWSWRACEGTRCQNIVYVDSLNPVSADGFRFSGDATTPSRVEDYRRSIAKVAALPCDRLLAVHPVLGEGKTCTTYAADGLKKLERRLAEEKRP